MKKKILVAAILFCIFSHISAEGYIRFDKFEKSSSGMITCITRLCISPEIKDIEVMKKKFYENSKDFKMMEQITNGFAATICTTLCVLQEKDSNSKTVYGILLTTFLDPNSKYPLPGTCVQVVKQVVKDENIILYEENYDNVNIANAEYDRLCKKYIGML